MFTASRSFEIVYNKEQRREAIFGVKVTQIGLMTETVPEFFQFSRTSGPAAIVPDNRVNTFKILLYHVTSFPLRSTRDVLCVYVIGFLRY